MSLLVSKQEFITKNTNPFGMATLNAQMAGCILQNHLSPCTLFDLYKMNQFVCHELRQEFSNFPYFFNNSELSTIFEVSFLEGQPIFSLQANYCNNILDARKVLLQIIQEEGRIVQHIITTNVQPQDYITTSQIDQSIGLHQLEQFELLYPDYRVVYDEKRMAPFEIRDSIPEEPYTYSRPIEEYKSFVLKKRANQ